MKDGMPMPMPEGLMRRLNAQGVYRLCCGHTPHGCCPTVIKSGGPLTREPHFQVIMADTSYSDMGAPDNRGPCVTEVQLLVDGRVRVHGLIKALQPEGDGDVCEEEQSVMSVSEPSAEHLDQVEYVLEPGVGPASELLGQVHGQAEGRRFVKAYLPHLHSFLLCHVHGFITTYDELSAEETHELFGVAAALTTPADKTAAKLGAPKDWEDSVTAESAKAKRRLQSKHHAVTHLMPFHVRKRSTAVPGRKSISQLSLVKHLDDHDEGSSSDHPNAAREKLAEHIFMQIDRSHDGCVAFAHPRGVGLVGLGERGKRGACWPMGD